MMCSNRAFIYISRLFSWVLRCLDDFFVRLSHFLSCLAAKINETDQFGPGDDDEIQFDDIGSDDEDIDDVSAGFCTSLPLQRQ